MAFGSARGSRSWPFLRWRRCLSGLRPTHTSEPGGSESRVAATLAWNAVRHRCGNPSGDRVEGSEERPSGCNPSGASASCFLREVGESRRRVTPSHRERGTFGWRGAVAAGTRTNRRRPLARLSTGVARAPLRGLRSAMRWKPGTLECNGPARRSSARSAYGVRAILRDARRRGRGSSFGTDREPGSGSVGRPQGWIGRRKGSAAAFGLRAVRTGEGWPSGHLEHRLLSEPDKPRKLAFNNVALGRRDTRWNGPAACNGHQPCPARKRVAGTERIDLKAHGSIEPCATETPHTRNGLSGGTKP